MDVIVRLLGIAADEEAVERVVVPEPNTETALVHEVGSAFHVARELDDDVAISADGRDVVIEQDNR